MKLNRDTAWNSQRSKIYERFDVIQHDPKSITSVLKLILSKGHYQVDGDEINGGPRSSASNEKDLWYTNGNIFGDL